MRAGASENALALITGGLQEGNTDSLAGAFPDRARSLLESMKLRALR